MPRGPGEALALPVKEGVVEGVRRVGVWRAGLGRGVKLGTPLSAAS